MIPVTALLAMTALLVACGAQEDGQETGGKTPKQVTMNKQQAIDRAEEIIHQAVDGMSPKPKLERIGSMPVGPCIARDDHKPDDRVQVTLAYKLTSVPGPEAHKLVRQARDAWLKQDYKYNSSGEVDWSGSFPSVYMRTEPDDFWMDAVTGVVDRAKGEGVASLKVTSPCFLPPEKSSASGATESAAPEDLQSIGLTRQRTLGHSSRIYDALQVGSAPTQQGEGLSTVRHDSRISVHHTWSTESLPEDERVRALVRARGYLESTGWSVRHLPTPAGTAAIVARHPAEGTIAQVAPSTTGTLRVAVTTPADGAASAGV
jgi:hypothetical protein